MFDFTDDQGSITVAGVRLEFRWTGDRWTHALAVGSGTDLVRLAQVIEGDGRDPTRVVSPAYQQLQFQPGEGQTLALLVGQSGPHHFSAVFAVREVADVVTVSVDVADRCRAEVAGLACTYMVDLPAGDLLEADSSRALWSPKPLGGGRLAFASEGSSRIVLAEGGRRATRIQAEATFEPGGLTHRWAYRWEWTPPVALVS